MQAVKIASSFAKGELLAMTLLLFSACSGSRLKVGKVDGGEVVVAEGSCPVKDGDLHAAKACSLAEAQKQALEKVIGVYISAKTRVEKAIAIEQNILAKTEGYISKYDIVKQWEEGGFSKTKIRAMVMFQKLNDDLKGLKILRSPAIGNPRVAVLITEGQEGSPDDDGATTFVSDAFAKALADAGFKIIDPDSLAAIKAYEQTDQIENDGEALAAMATKVDAEIVIMGDAKADRVDLASMNLGSMNSYRVALSAKADKSSNGEVLETVSEQASGLDITDSAAKQKAFQAAGKKCGELMAASLPQRLLKAMTLTVIARGLTSIDELSALQKALSAAPGIEEMYLRSFSEGTGVIDLERSPRNQTTTQEIGDYLSRRDFKVEGILDNTLTVSK